MKNCMDLKTKKTSYIKTAMWGAAAAVIGTASSIIPGWATSTSIGSMTTSFKTAAQSIYNNLLIIAPIAACVIIAVLVLLYIFTTDERDAAAIKKRCIKIAVAVVIIFAIPVLIKVLVDLGTSMSGGTSTLTFGTDT